MWRLGWIRSVRTSKAENPARPAAGRDRFAVQIALVTVVCLGCMFILSKGTTFLMPGPLASAHGGIEKCSACHTKSGSGKLSWTHGLVAGDPRADSKACLSCHKMPDTAFNPHGASADALEKSTERLAKISAETPQPQSARTQSIVFPTHDVEARGLACATCHQEHQGGNFNLNKISNEQCRSCHVVKFDSFDGHHPKFENYPFKQRTRIIYDHGGHFGKHYPELAKKDPSKNIPATCSTCHNSNDDERIMAVAPFEKTCSECHLDKITGKERVSGPKGIAFLSLPGIDLQSLKNKNASIGEWPDASDAALTPFMKVMISRNERGRAVIKIVDGLNLQDLSDASDGQIKAVTGLVWEIKALFHALIAGKASDALGDLNIGGGAKLSASLVADLTANIPRDVVISAQQQWLPNLATEIADPQGLGRAPSQDNAAQPDGAATANSDGGNETLAADRASSTAKDSKSEPSELSGERSNSDDRDAASSVSPQADRRDAANTPKRDPQACIMRVLGQCLMFKGREDEATQSAGAGGQTESANPKPGSGKAKSSAAKLPPAMRAGLNDAGPAAEPKGVDGKTYAANAKPDAKESPTAGAQPQGKASDQSDELLFPTEEELREIKARSKDSARAARPESADAAPKADADTPAGAPANAAAQPQTRAASVISIESNVDPESWAEYGGWYRQDYAIFYRPTGHKDKFIYSWLFLTGPQAPKSDTSPVAAVFDFLTGKDAQGSCTKCHSVDDIPGKGRVVNFSQPSVEGKQGRFTSFIHEPHFGSLGDRGCLTCHAIGKDRAYLKSYEQGNPQNFVSNFGAVKKELCQTCHNSSKARQDCLTCHKYHVNGVITPIMSTKLPNQ